MPFMEFTVFRALCRLCRFLGTHPALPQMVVHPENCSNLSYLRLQRRFVGLQVFCFRFFCGLVLGMCRFFFWWPGWRTYELLHRLPQGTLHHERYGLL